jgi:hypothetical protein
VRFAADAVPASALDIFAAAIGIAVFSPILPISAMAIKIAWRGPVLTQEAVFDKCNARPVQALRFGVGPGSRATNLSQALRHSGIDNYLS